MVTAGAPEPWPHWPPAFLFCLQVNHAGIISHACQVSSLVTIQPVHLQFNALREPLIDINVLFHVSYTQPAFPWEDINIHVISDAKAALGSGPHKRFTNLALGQTSCLLHRH